MGDDARESVFHLQHILVGVFPVLMAAVAVAAFVVAVAVSVVGVAMAGRGMMRSHNANVRSERRCGESVNRNNRNRFQENCAVVLNN